MTYTYKMFKLVAKMATKTTAKQQSQSNRHVLKSVTVIMPD